MFTIVSHLLAAWFCFLLPSYGTFKALAHRPVSEPELERWSQYWAVIGIVVTFEHLAEFLISWVPFYWELKTLFLLFLSLPQTQGSTYIYMTYLQPFFTQNEADLDAGILSIQRKTLFFAQARLAALWQFILNALNKNAATGQQASATPGQAPPQGAGFSMESAMGLFRTYGPSLMTALQPAAAPATPPVSSRPAPNASSSSFGTPNVELRARATFAEAAPPFPEPEHHS
ncbi:TB2/DP1, HVA22 family-domain-containing protein [Mycena belliarum]|uniref:Protein YOP1 n=1 Tax=Mycena belliarum TaxID=1033014 RepID=A0AAD6UKF3_9AGAR|nr:TB2/DP1, HVA22 family-domain-containing protein [Mycena belliae]